MDPGAVAKDTNAKGISENLTDSIVRTMFPSAVDATTVKTRTNAAGVVETLGGVGALYEVRYEVTDAAGCTAGLRKSSINQRQQKSQPSLMPEKMIPCLAYCCDGYCVQSGFALLTNIPTSTFLCRSLQFGDELRHRDV
jgi:hypothetical protein